MEKKPATGVTFSLPWFLVLVPAVFHGAVGLTLSSTSTSYKFLGERWPVPETNSLPFAPENSPGKGDSYWKLSFFGGLC